jgi:hypothetical protein
LIAYRLIWPAFVATAVPSCVDAMRASSAESSDPIRAALASITRRPHRALCPERPGRMRCLARIRTDESGAIYHPQSTTGGFEPADLASAYNLPAIGGAGQTVALIDALDNPNAEQDLATYRTMFGLPPCTTANGCFRKVNQDGLQGPYPVASPDWAGEIMLDIEMASAACPGCNILLVEASTESSDDLGAAVNTAARLGATAISNSYGSGEDSTILGQEESYYHHPGVFQVASSGDGGYGTIYPSTSKYILAIGGTSLVQAPGTMRGWAESAWDGGGSGCSAVISKPLWQTDADCTSRTAVDVAAVGDPNTGVSVYDSYGSGGWVVMGGTSASAPIVAGIFALKNSTRATPEYPYRHPEAFYDVTMGSNGSCGTSYLCNAGVGYDGPTGMGTPNGSVIVGPRDADASVPDARFEPDAFVPDAAPDASLPDAFVPDAIPSDASAVARSDAGERFDADQIADGGGVSPTSGASAEQPTSGRIGGGCSCAESRGSVNGAWWSFASLALFFARRARRSFPGTPFESWQWLC